MRQQVTAHARSGVQRLRHPSTLRWQALLVIGWLLAVIGDVSTTAYGLFSGGFSEGDGAAAAAMSAVTVPGYLATVGAAGLVATVLVAGRPVAWWSRLLLTVIGVLTVIKLAAVTWNLWQMIVVAS